MCTVKNLARCLLVLVLQSYFYLPTSGVISEQAQAWCAHTNSNREPSVLFYNRIPKCGSSTMKSLYNVQSKTNDFDYVDLPDVFYNHRPEDPIDQMKRERRLINHIKKHRTNSSRRLAIVGHAEYSPIISKGLHQFSDVVEYTNMVRQCNSRVTSHVAYSLHTCPLAMKAKSEKTLPKYQSSVNLLNTTSPKACLQNSTCFRNAPVLKSTRNTNIIGRYISGMIPTKLNKMAFLNKTRHAITQGYMKTVGLLENITEYLEMLECVYPSYFTGAPSFQKKHRRSFKVGLAHMKNISASQKTELKILKEASISLCKGSPDEILYEEIETMFWERYQAMKENPDYCCRPKTNLKLHSGSK